MDVVFSGDGRRLRSASADGTIRDWSVASPAEKPRSNKRYFLRAISRDGSRIALTPEFRGSKELKVLDNRGREILSLALPSGSADEAAFSPDGRRLAAIWDDGEAKTVSLKIWNAATGAKLLDTPLGKDTFSSSLEFSPDGRRIAASMSARDSANRGDTFTHSVKMWDAGNGKELFSWQWQGIGPDTKLDFRPDGARLAALCTDGTLRIWETAGGQELLTRKYVGSWPPHIKYSPDGRLLVCNFGAFAAGGSPRVRDAETGDDLFALTGHSGSIVYLAFSPDGRRIATASGGRRGKCELKLWDAGSGQELMSFSSEVRRWWLVQFSSDGRQLMAVRDDSLEDLVQVWDATPLPQR